VGNNEVSSTPVAPAASKKGPAAPEDALKFWLTELKNPTDWPVIEVLKKLALLGFDSPSPPLSNTSATIMKFWLLCPRPTRTVTIRSSIRETIFLMGTSSADLFIPGYHHRGPPSTEVATH
jgi:hypothetical protein